MDFRQFQETVSQHYEKQLPFALYSFPDSDTISGLLQQDQTLSFSNALAADGFVMAPFDAFEKTVVIPNKNAVSVQTILNPITIDFQRTEIDEDQSDHFRHKELVQSTINTIKSGKAKKIVIARQKEIPLNDFDIRVLINQLFSSYPTAFRYIWYHPETGIWCGATPETLVEVHQREFKTMALAGTQAFKEGEVTWRKKEIEEQHFVTEAIVDDLKPFVEQVKVGPVETIRAGSLLHLKCDIIGTMKDERETLLRIIEKMHPTPAVCGTPQDFSKRYIIENEVGSREFYTGYVGPLTDEGLSAAFFVNLRSMKISNNVATLFIGGGITADSDPEEEWNETRNKMQTMLQVLRPML